MQLVLFFFFQAEDGIRDLVRSRGLGDVYKRQKHFITIAGRSRNPPWLQAREFTINPNTLILGLTPVSYTHLTLPTSDLV